jgi:hypothetical protein
MARIRVLGFATLLAGSLALGACGDGTAPKLAPITVDSILVELAETQALGASGFIITGSFGFGAAVPTSECPFNASNQRFVCEPVTLDGFTTTRYYQLLDASGAAQSAFNRATTAAFRTVSDVAGSITEEYEDEVLGPVSTTLTITAHDDQTLSGLLTATHVLNGTSNTDLTLAMTGETPLVLAVSSQTHDLVLPPRGAANKYPRSGSIVMNLTAEGETTTITMTFNGTRLVTMSIVSPGFSATCTIDLEDPESFGACGA